ncbi:STAS/SEC14 domain-containing protein [Cesiribacter sp. SM1]|uniref:STAS/SEC14 domain-containing protein n=1 Tax=Cesiribacter sp. SM1 TaxID=2861196 RepID=UPI001CD63DDE|nr:STAS/SEC14 domain-containing protein [Cesiribacter sp. SM1]
MKLWESPIIRIDFDENSRVLTQVWKGFGSSELFREAIDKTVYYFIQKKAAYILADSSTGAIVKKEDTDYAAQKAVQLVKNGIKAQAFVLPANVFVKASAQNFANGASAYQIQYFDDKDKAMEWLIAQA